jgi:exodeoxyribonuclease VII small subunit
MRDKDLNFEKALADLEKIVEKLEQSGLGLNESLGLFEKGVHLAKYLRAEIDKAEKKVEILLKDDKGDLRARPFDLDDEDSGEAAAAVAEDAAIEAPEAETEKKPKTRTPRKKPEGGDDTLPF